MSADDYPVTSAIATLTLKASPPPSSFLARIQRRFTLLGCCMASLPEGMALQTAWDVSNPEGTKLEPSIFEALSTFVGVDDATACPGSIRAEAPAGTCLAGPRIDAALALELLPLEKAARAAMEAKSKKAAAAAAAAASKLEAQQKRRKDDDKQGAAAKEPKARGGAAMGEAKLQLCAVELQRPSAPNGEWLNIRVLGKEGVSGNGGGGGGGGIAATKKEKGASHKKGGSGSEGTSSAAKKSAAPTTTSGSGEGGGGRLVATEPGAGTTVAAVGNIIQPLYRSTRETAAMQQALLHAASGGHAEQAYLFHSGRLPWHAAIEAP